MERKPVSFAQAMIELAEDPELRQQLGKAARKKALREYDEERTIERLQAFYRELLEKVS